MAEVTEKKPQIFHYAYTLKDEPRPDGTYFVTLMNMCGSCWDGWARREFSLWDMIIGSTQIYCPRCGNKHDYSDWLERISKEIEKEEARGNEVANKKELYELGEKRK